MKKFVSAIGALGVIAPGVAMAATPGQFPDVQPTNWAYQAILNLRDKYGCAVGFPDGTFRAGRPATRAELAALTNACLDEIVAYSDSRDAALASALRAEIGKVGSRVTALEVVAARKNEGVGNYVGLGVLLNRQGVDGNGYTEERVISGATLQGRHILTKALGGEISIRPYLNAVGTPSGEIGAGGGALASYDFSIARSKSGVSKANIYAGAGYQIPFVNNTDANYQSAVGEKGQAVFALGVEGRLTNSLVGFADVKFPTTNATIEDEHGDRGAYSPVFTTGVGIKF